MAHHHCSNLDMEGKADYLEKMKELCKNAPECERRRRLPWGKIVGEGLSEMRRVAEKKLVEHYSKGTTGTVYKSRTKVLKESTSAGYRCDNCQKTRAELGEDQFRCCSNCQFEYYCSRECQRSAWKNGHNERCRPIGDFRPGDQALEEKEQVQLVQYLDEMDSWVVVNCRGTDERTVSSKELRRLRPALWHDLNAYKFFTDMNDSEEAEYWKNVAIRDDAASRIEETGASLEEADASLEEACIKAEEEESRLDVVGALVTQAQSVPSLEEKEGLED